MLSQPASDLITILAFRNNSNLTYEESKFKLVSALIDQNSEGSQYSKEIEEY